MQGSSASCFKQESYGQICSLLAYHVEGGDSDLLSMQVRPIRPRFSLEDLITCLILLACSAVLTTGNGSPPSGFGCLMIGSSNQWVLRYSSKLDRLSQCMLLAAEVDQGKKKILSKVAHLCSQPRLQIPVYLRVTTWSSYSSTWS